ncbi:hypothetical protein OEZ86_014724 [Tetradesmus obliquus]|nr:hypothetical protein OEZ86_014724 [Tetradesmus obliquus]
MCRFTVTEPSQQVERDLADGFNWFDAIDEICEGEEDDQLLVKEEEQLEPQPGDNLLDVWCQQINGELAQAGATGWMAEPASAAMQQAPAATPALHQAPMYGFLGQVVVPQAHAGLASTSSGSVDDEFSCDGEQPMASGASDSQQKHSNNAAGKHTVKHTKVSKAALAAMDEASKLERVKQKRRESASRSRARKNAYMKELEGENMALRGQVESLQKALGQLQAYVASMGAPLQGGAPSMACC